jgi:hypothetical protein
MNKKQWFNELDRVCILQTGCNHLEVNDCWIWDTDRKKGLSPNQSFSYWYDLHYKIWFIHK